MVHLTLGEWRVACARVTVPEGDLVLACGALATPTGFYDAKNDHSLIV
jgi:hypothetical protein